MRPRHRITSIIIFIASILVVSGIALFAVAHRDKGGQISKTGQPSRPTIKPKSKANSRVHVSEGLVQWWDGFTDDLRKLHMQTAGPSNIHREDYAGPEACKNCHKKQYENWLEHPHRRMNARVEDFAVKGDFSGKQMSYLGGTVTFYQSDNSYRMKLERGDSKREYVVDQTIGSRFFQYYIGKQFYGPEVPEHPLYTESHVLPLGYWLDRKEWVPVVHVHDDDEGLAERPKHDPFVRRELTAADKDLNVYGEKTKDLYRAQCNYCHTTFPLGDMMTRHPDLIGRHSPAQMDFSLSDYIPTARPDLWPQKKDSREFSSEAFASMLKSYRYSDAREHAVTLGISCEACHLGSKEHAKGKLKKPKFFPNASELGIHRDPAPHDMGRTHDNINYTCGRCHSGNRPLYSAGMATWNSTEFADASRGHCYSQLTCVRCHDPHTAMGSSWKKTPLEDDAICLSCHTGLKADAARQKHTRHSLDGEGSRCMNCHMPRINEGLQEVVRTHTIFSPTNRAMIESNQMNACNQCHVDKPIDWTLAYLNDWYQASYDGTKISKSYPDRNLPATINWLRGSNEAVRLVAADSLTRANAKWAMSDLLNALDDPFLLNRLFARIGLERMLQVPLSDFSYQYFMTPEERAAPLKAMREKLTPATENTKTTSR